MFCTSLHENINFAASAENDLLKICNILLKQTKAFNGVSKMLTLI